VSVFRFEALRPDGARVRGRLEAAHRGEAAATISRRGLLPLAVEAVHEARRPVLGRPSARECATFFRSVATLTGVGVPLLAAVRSSQAAVGGVLREAVVRVEQRVREGQSLSRALERERGLFSDVTLGLVAAGERGAGLATGLSHAAADLERRADTAGRVRAALAYPAVLLSLGTASLLAILVVVVPRFAAILGEVEAALPLSTRLLIAASAGLRHHVLPLALAVLVVAVGLAALLRSWRRSWHEWLLVAPVVGSVRHGLASARSSRTLGALLDSGTPALAALRVAAQTVGDEAVARRLALAAERVAQGAALSAALAAEKALTPLALQISAVGDGIGRVPELLLRAADLEEETAERRIRAAVALIEPVVVVAFAAAVAFVASALLQAIYGIRPVGL